MQGCCQIHLYMESKNSARRPAQRRTTSSSVRSRRSSRASSRRRRWQGRAGLLAPQGHLPVELLLVGCAAPHACLMHLIAHLRAPGQAQRGARLLWADTAGDGGRARLAALAGHRVGPPRPLMATLMSTRARAAIAAALMCTKVRTAITITLMSTRAHTAIAAALMCIRRSQPFRPRP